MGLVRTLFPLTVMLIKLIEIIIKVALVVKKGKIRNLVGSRNGAPPCGAAPAQAPTVEETLSFLYLGDSEEGPW